MEDFENKPDDKEAPKDLVEAAIELGTKDGAVLVTDDQGKKQLFEEYQGEIVEIDDNGTKWGIDPETGERTRVVEYGDVSQD